MRRSTAAATRANAPNTAPEPSFPFAASFVPLTTTTSAPTSSTAAPTHDVARRRPRVPASPITSPAIATKTPAAYTSSTSAPRTAAALTAWSPPTNSRGVAAPTRPRRSSTTAPPSSTAARITSVTPVSVCLPSSRPSCRGPSKPRVTCVAEPTPNGVDWSATSNTIQLVNSRSARPRRMRAPARPGEQVEGEVGHDAQQQDDPEVTSVETLAVADHGECPELRDRQDECRDRSRPHGPAHEEAHRHRGCDQQQVEADAGERRVVVGDLDDEGEDGGGRRALRQRHPRRGRTRGPGGG